MALFSLSAHISCTLIIFFYPKRRIIFILFFFYQNSYNLGKYLQKFAISIILVTNIFHDYDNISNDLIWGFNVHQLKIIKHKTTGWLWLSRLGLATKCISSMTSVYLVSFCFNNYLILNLMKVFLSLQVCL